MGGGDMKGSAEAVAHGVARASSPRSAPGGGAAVGGGVAAAAPGLLD